MLVIDCSATLALCFEGEDDQYAEKLMQYFIDNTATAPEIWPLEVCNSLLTAITRRRLAKAEANRFFYLVSSLPISIVTAHKSLNSYASVYELAGKYQLSAYDASYLALAMDKALPLATLDLKLIHAATSAGVKVF
jgi:predicted nucleic acid-binding protein